LAADLRRPLPPSACTFLQPIGGDGTTPIVKQAGDRAKLLRKTNWNTDFNRRPA